MKIEIVPAGDGEYETVNNLAKYYYYDMAEHAGFPFDANGDFTVGDALNPFWRRARPSREWPAAWKGHAFLARVDGNPAGFALVNEQGPLIDMAEFFVARQYRRHDMGRKLAYAMFDRFRGPWEVREMMTNLAAQKFWNRIIADYTKGDFTETTETFERYGGKEFVVQRFNSAKRG